MGSKQPFSVHNILGKPPHDIKLEDVYSIEKLLGACCFIRRFTLAVLACALAEVRFWLHPDAHLP